MPGSITAPRRSLLIAMTVGALLCGLAACGTSTPPVSKAPASEAPSQGPAKEKAVDAEPPPAPPRRVLGGTDSACDLPFQFALAAKWKPEKVSSEFDQGDFRAVCEVDAKPAGNLGIMRIWLPEPDGPASETSATPGADPQRALASFLAAGAGKVEKPKFRTLDTSPAAGAQVVYTRYLPEVDERKQESAFALPTSRGLAIVTISGLDTEEYLEMLPAWVLAKTTVQAE